MPQAMDLAWGELGDGQSQFLPVDTVALALSDNEVIQLGSRERRATTRKPHLPLHPALVLVLARSCPAIAPFRGRAQQIRLSGFVIGP